MRAPIKPHVDAARFEPRKPTGVYLMELRSRAGSTQRLRIEVTSPASSETEHYIAIRRPRRPVS